MIFLACTLNVSNGKKFNFTYAYVTTSLVSMNVFSLYEHSMYKTAEVIFTSMIYKCI